MTVDIAHYWYEASSHERGIAVLEAMRSYRAAEAAMRRRTQNAMNMGENDLLALRYLLRAESQGRQVTPKQLAGYLGISSASTTALIDRLQRSGHVERRPGEQDRRSIVIAATVASDAEVRATLGEMHTRMIAVARGLDPDAAAQVIQFLDDMRDAVDRIDGH